MDADCISNMQSVTSCLTPDISRRCAPDELVSVTGPRQSGKTTLLQRDHRYAAPTCEPSPFRTREFLAQFHGPVILRRGAAPELFSYIQVLVDDSSSPVRDAADCPAAGRVHIAPVALLTGGAPWVSPAHGRGHRRRIGRVDTGEGGPRRGLDSWSGAPSTSRRICAGCPRVEGWRPGSFRRFVLLCAGRAGPQSLGPRRRLRSEPRRAPLAVGARGSFIGACRPTTRTSKSGDEDALIFVDRACCATCTRTNSRSTRRCVEKMAPS